MKDIYKKHSSLILVIGILIVFAILVGVTYAWFSTTLTGSGGSASVTTADLGPITYASTDMTPVAVRPGWESEDATLTISGDLEGGFTQKYYCTITNLGGVTDVEYRISADGASNSTSATWKSIANNPIVTGTITGSNSSDVYKYAIRFVDTGENQNDQMGKALSVVVTCALGEYTEGSTLYDKLLADNPTISTRTTFNDVFTTNTQDTLYKTTENGVDVYYFAGIENDTLKIDNWVKFGKESKNGECTYNGEPVIYVNLSTDEGKYEGLTESECSTVGICSADGMYVLGLSEEICTSEDIGGTWINDSGTYSGGEYDLYWRIIRTNEDGSVRLMYHGNSVDDINAIIGNGCYSEDCATGDASYVSYGISNAKVQIDAWYENIFLKYHDINGNMYNSYISETAKYCNDMTVSRTNRSDIYFAGHDRLYKTSNNTAHPTYNCSGDNVYSKVNGKLTYPVALVTADEISYAGGAYGTSNEGLWYYRNSVGGSSRVEWWTMSPSYFSIGAYVWFVGGDSFNPGRLTYRNVDSAENAFTPVVSVKSGVKVTGGNGSAASPYELGL